VLQYLLNFNTSKQTYPYALFVFLAVKEMERKQGIDFRLGACASEDAERRMPRVQNM
jgi:hypothetical protein